MRAAITLLLALFHLLTPVLPAGLPALDGGGQRFRVVDRLGGQVTAAHIWGADVLAAEGDRLVRLRVDAVGDLVPAGSIALGHGPILDLASNGAALYALTDTGIVTLAPDGSAVHGFTPGGGQLLDAWGDRLAVAAREAGIRLYRLDPDGMPHLARLFVTAGDAQHVAFTESGRMVVADGRAGLRLYDMRDPVRPAYLGSLPSIAPAERVAADDGRVLVTSRHKMHIVDTSNPAAPTLTGVYNPVQAAQAVAWANGYALIADAEGGLKVYDAESLRYRAAESTSLPGPTAALLAAHGLVIMGQGRTLRVFDAGQLPAIVPRGSITLPGPVTGIAALPDQPVLLVAMDSAGLGVVSVQNPYAPALWTALPLQGPARGVAVSDDGTRAFIAVLNAGLLVVDIRDPMFPHIESGVPLSGRPGNVALAGSLAVVAAGPGGLFVIDPGAPGVRGWLLPGVDGPGYTAVVTIGPDRVAALDGDQIVLVDLANPDLPRVLHRQDARAAALTASGDGTLIAAGENRLARYDTGDDTLDLQAAYAAPTALTGVRMLVGRAILANGGDGAALVLLDMQNPFAPVELQVFEAGSPALALRDQGDEIFLAAGGGGLIHALLPAQGSPRLLGQYRPAWATAVLAGDGARLLAGGAGWSAIRAAGDGLRLDGGASSGPVAAVALVGDWAIIAPEGGGIARYDLNSRPPAPVSQAQTTGTVIALAVSGDTLWALESGAGLVAYDLRTLSPRSDPFWPDDSPTALAVSGTTAYVGLDSGLLLILDVSALPPRVIGQIDDLGGPVRDVRLAGEGRLIISAGAGGAWLVDVRDPATPQAAAHLMPPGGALAAAWQDGTLAIATGRCGVRLYDATMAERGYWYESYAADVAFLGELIALATTGGVLALAYDPDGAPVLPPPPHSPIPPDNSEHPPGSITALAWEPGADACDPLAWEVAINGRVVVTVSEPHYILRGGPGGGLAWQVTAIDAQGDRTPGPEWRFAVSESGWMAAPPVVRLPASPERDTRRAQWLVIGIGAAAGLLALGGLVGWRRRR